MKVIYSFGWVGGYAGNDLIVLNSNLKKYPKFHDLVLEHEKEHLLQDKKKFYTKKDAWHDLKDLFNPNFQLRSLVFNLRHPTSLLPFFYYKEDNETKIAIVFPWVYFYEIFLIVFIWGFLYG